MQPAAGLLRCRLCGSGRLAQVMQHGWKARSVWAAARPACRLPVRPVHASGASQPKSATAQPGLQAGSGAASGSPPASRQGKLTFQEAIVALEQYWARQSGLNCAVLLPHNSEVGAGTMNPATFLRVCGPEPWHVCYPEPSVRPDDSRYGRNPNRVQRHTQFQVIIKPDPGNPQELYLGSLEAIGIDVAAHDIRFVEDNWESPVLGAWGLGWEVWCDGQEITQFTYFQQAGGKPLSHPAIEITYGLERILMALQGARHFKDIQYAQGITYGELFLQGEEEWSAYNLEQADVAGQRSRFDLYRKEAERLLQQRLPVPAYDHLLKLSHAFNVMDARGAVGVTERAECFATLRGLARQVTGLWMARREELGHPLGVLPSPADARQPTAVSSAGRAAVSNADDFVLELGCEELPPLDVDSAVKQLRTRVPELLERLRLSHGAVDVQGTPRRLAVMVQGLGTKQPDAVERSRGPPAKVAFGADGVPTKALQGFCRKSGISVEGVTREADAKGTEYVWAEVQRPGRTAAEVLADELPALLASLSFKRSMRWSSSAAFSRPLRWLLALHGASVLQMSYAGLQAGCSTRLLRTSPQPVEQLEQASDYQAALERQGIVLNQQQRAHGIWQAVREAAASVGGHVPDSAQADLLAEVFNLVEAPRAILGSFDRQFLELPAQVLVMVMRKHQRYFPLYAQGGSPDLLPHFVTVANGPVDKSVVQAGNEAVLHARFQDAQFFFQEDLKRPLQDMRPQLAGTLFQRDLGSLYDKSVRVERLVPALAELAGLQSAAATAQTAAQLALADLASSTVTEMTALAGTFGRILAQRQGQDPAVAEAIFESTLPQPGSAALPASPAGTLVSLADKLDTLTGLVAAGCMPTANADPFNLRRIAYGMLQTLLHRGVALELPAAVSLAAELQPLAVSQEQQQQALDFVTRRLEQLLLDKGNRVEAVRAVMRESTSDACRVQACVEQLQAELEAGEGSLLPRTMAAFARPTRIVRGKAVAADWAVREDLFELEEERQLWAVYQQVASQVEHQRPGITDFLRLCEQLTSPIDAYFDKVFVMTEQEEVQRSRLALLRHVAMLPRGLLDFSELPGF